MTVRFMMQYEEVDPSEYFAEFAHLVGPLTSGFVYLRPDNAVANSRLICRLRGEQWTRKEETSTPYVNRNILAALEGMRSFWARYAGLCDSLFEIWKLPKKQIRFEHGDYSQHTSRIWMFLDNLGVVNADEQYS